jgi:hypothetical protein
MYKKNLWIAFFFSGLFLNIQAQEQLLGLNLNPSFQKQVAFKSTQESAVFLPFFDDFKQTELLPNPKLWADKNVFVNTGFQKFPTNLGVATLDAMDENGAIYDHANSFGFIADYLTSNKIRLDSLADENRPIVAADSLYLSFYYQPQGRGNAPEPSDSLVLEFYSGSDKLWYRVWAAEGMPLDSFYFKNQTYCNQVLIPIINTDRFFHPDFRFRFYNYASLASTIQTSWQSNADQWNIDYIKLDVGRSRNDIYSEDLVFVNPPPSFLKKYRSMPYNQYKNDPTNSMADSLNSIYISNLNALPYTAEYQYSISNQSLQDSIYLAGAANINPFIFEGYSAFPRFKDPRVISFFSLYNEAQMEYTITHIVRSLDTKNDHHPGDTLIQKQIFADYFAYDDGSPEAGYGLSAIGNSAALRFKLNMPDTLTQVQFYFNPTSLGNEDYFYLTVWESLDPEVILYEKLVQVSQSENESGFEHFDLNELVVVSNEFFVGFTQTTENNLNVGFDLSFSPPKSLFFDAGDGWNSSIFEGALMIRPVFSSSDLTVDLSSTIADNGLRIFPNPLKSGKLNIVVDNGSDYVIRVYSLLGKLVYSTEFQEQINLSFLKEGVYLLRFENQFNGEVKSQKLIINK